MRPAPSTRTLIPQTPARLRASSLAVLLRRNRALLLRAEPCAEDADDEADQNQQEPVDGSAVAVCARVEGRADYRAWAEVVRDDEEARGDGQEAEPGDLEQRRRVLGPPELPPDRATRVA